MSSRGSKSSVLEALGKYSEPLLAIAYKSAVRTVCGRFSRVAKKYHPRFIAIQKRLDKLNVAYDRYAYAVVKSWWAWCQAANMPIVPVSLFCGEKAWNRFLEDSRNKPTVQLDTNMERMWSESVHEELCVAQAYIARKLCNPNTRLDGVREQLAPLFRRYADNGQVTEEVVGLLNLLYDCRADNYDGVVEAIR